MYIVVEFGWEAETREQLLDRFVCGRPDNPSMSEEDIMNEVIAVRYAR